MRTADATPRTSPVLVGRDDLLDLAERRLGEARSGRGQVLFLAGEAGIGKTRLLGALERRAALNAMSVVRAAAFPRDLEITGGPFLDLARALDADASHGELATRLRQRLDEADTAVVGDAHRRRRLLVLDLVELLAALAEDAPVVLSLEDLHWADDLTLEVLAQLARRLREMPLLVAATYRSDELYPRAPMREWRSRLLSQRLVEEVRLARLDLEQTAVLARVLLGDPAAVSHALAEELHRRSDGIPLHVEELLGAMVADGSERGAPVPDTLADAVNARADRLTAGARSLAEAAAVIGRSFDSDLLAAIVSRGGADIDRALRDLQDRFFVVPGRRAGWYDFRHALIRDALYARVGPRARRRLHARLGTLLVERGDGDEAAIAAHFELAGDADEAHLWARRAADRARRLSSHREAAELYRRALRTMPAAAPAIERAAVFAAYAAEAAASDDNAGAADAYLEARRLLLAAGDPAAAAALVPALVAVRHLLGASLDERVELLDLGLRELASAGSGDGHDGLRADLLAGLSAAYMLDRRLDESIEHGEAARSEASRSGDARAELNASVTLGADFVFAGRMDEGWGLLEGAVATARDGGLEAEAARAFRMIGSGSSVVVEYDRAEAWLRDGIEYAERVELWNDRHYMAAHLAHVAWATGEWDRAAALATEALADGRGGITTRITALHVLGYIAMGRGEVEAAERWLGEAREAGERMNELQRLSPALWGLAETALLDGRAEEAAALCEAGRRASAAVLDAAYLFPYAVTGTRALLDLGRPLEAERWLDEVAAILRRRSIPGTLHAVAHAEGLLLLARGSTRAARRRLAEARDGWAARRRRWEQAWALLDLARAEVRSNRRSVAAGTAGAALELTTEMGAAPLAARAEDLRRDLRADRHQDPAWAPLTAREFEVARLIADGRTNAEIAAELGIAPKTVSAHVEHILDRLGAGRRAEVAAWVAGRVSSGSVDV